MGYTFKELAVICDVPANTLLQWRHRGLLPDGDLDHIAAHFALWLGDLTKRGVSVGKAFELYTEGLHRKGKVLAFTVDGPQWLSDGAYRKKLMTHFEDDPFFFAVSFPHWFKRADDALTNFRRIDQFHKKAGTSAEQLKIGLTKEHADA